MVQMEGSKMSVARTRINNKPLSPSLLGNEEKTNVFNSRLNKPDGTSFHQITNKTQAVTPAVLENWINETAGPSWVSKPATTETRRSIRCFYVSR